MGSSQHNSPASQVLVISVLTWAGTRGRGHHRGRGMLPPHFSPRKETTVWVGVKHSREHKMETGGHVSPGPQGVGWGAGWRAPH